MACGSRPARVAPSAHTATVAQAIECAFGTCEVLIAQRDSPLAAVGAPHLSFVLRPRIAIGVSGMASLPRLFGGEPRVMGLSRTQSATVRQVASICVDRPVPKRKSRPTRPLHPTACRSVARRLRRLVSARRAASRCREPKARGRVSGSPLSRRYVTASTLYTPRGQGSQVRLEVRSV